MFKHLTSWLHRVRPSTPKRVSFLPLAMALVCLSTSLYATTFTDISDFAGITLATAGPENDFGGGVAFFDYDFDGDIDLYVAMESGVGNRLYQNDGTGVFNNVAAFAGVDDVSHSRGIKVADYNNDGFQDFVVINQGGPPVNNGPLIPGPLRLYKNRGDGTFANATVSAGLSHTGAMYGGAWGDYDNDGHLDLYVVGYYEANLLYHNNGNGTFSEVGGAMGVQDAVRPGFDASWFDFNNDGRQDLYVINDLYSGNVLYKNNPNGTFSNVSIASGAGIGMAAMGIAIADYDHNGYMDLYITNTQGVNNAPGNVLLHNNGNETFSDMGHALRVRVQRTGWGTVFFDYDNDGWDDLYVVNYKFDGAAPQSQNVMFHNDGGTFTNSSAATGTDNSGPGFGVTIGDCNKDGFLDMFVLNRNAPCVLYENSSNGNKWLRVSTVGTTSNRDGIGARIRVVANGMTQIKSVRGGSSYLSQLEREVSFGLGSANQAATVEIKWPSGTIDTYNNVAANQTLRVTEGASSAQPLTYVEVSQSAGINITPNGERDDWGHGAAFRDYDNDGDVDLFVVMHKGQANKLYQNQGDGYFVDVAATANVAAMSNGRGAVWGDYDNDGDADLFVAVSSNLPGGDNPVANHLYRNNGDGTFSNRATFAGVNLVGRFHSACWGDYNNDGWLDLFVGSYGIVSNEQPNALFLNDQNGKFTEVAAAMGVDVPDKPALANAWIDYDNDGDLDLYIAYDKLRGNELYRNDNGTFTDVSAASKSNILFNAMGIAIGDYDHNGYFDMYITNTSEGNALLKNNGDGTFGDVAATLGISVNRIGWGTEFLDYDNDGDEDLYVVNWSAFGVSPLSENVLFRNDGGAFTNITAQSNAGDQNPTFAMTIADINKDGFPDIFSHSQEYPSQLLECVPGTHNWIKVKPLGTASNRDGIGASIRVVAGSLDQLKAVRSGSSYLSGLDRDVTFGLAGLTTIDLIEVKWPSGTIDQFTNITNINQTLTITEGGSAVPVLITRFGAMASSGSVELSWAVSRDEAFQGFRIYRLGEGESAPRSVATVADVTATTHNDRDVTAGATYRYTLAVVLADGSEMISTEARATVPFGQLSLSQNFPNPFNPTTNIRFNLPAREAVELVVYDARGRRVRELLNGARDAGAHDVVWDGRNDVGNPVSTGIYFYRLTSDTAILTRKMVLLK